MFVDLDEKYTPTIVEFHAARARALDALASEKVGWYYDPAGDYAGTTFAAMGAHEPDRVTGDDLTAITLLGVQVSPYGVRALLGDGSEARAVRTALTALEATDLRDATAEDFQAMDTLQSAVKDAIANPTTSTSNKWVTAAKICARKRPALIPVRDRKVGELLGPRALGSSYVYWQLMRGLLVDASVTDAIGEARSRMIRLHGDPAGEMATEPDLRILDAALWMKAAR